MTDRTPIPWKWLAIGFAIACALLLIGYLNGWELP